VQAYLRETGAEDKVRIAPRPVFPFVDVKRHLRWSVRPNMGRIPWWIFFEDRTVPEARLTDYLGMLRIARIRDNRPVADSMRRGWLYWRLVEPLAVAALNTASQAGLARLLGAVMRETLMRGGRACRPVLPTEGLSEAMVDPAIATLQQRGAVIRFNSRVAELVLEGQRVTGLRCPDGPIPLSTEDAVILAVPPWVATGLLPGLEAPDEFEAILNIHFRFDADPNGPLGEAGFLGLTSGTAEWLFMKPGHVSVTISAANGMVDDPARAIAEKVWPNVVDALGLGPAIKDLMPPFRVVKEKRATFAATAVQDAKRPGTTTPLATNVALAGDWTDTGLPATIEGAIRSGRVAADVLLSR
jgi:squalene-associated FAD-dependent desaturase